MKKGVANQIIGIFVLVLIISVLVGMTFIFTSHLKTQILDTTATTSITLNETGAWINESGYTLDRASMLGFRGLTIIAVYNVTNATGEGGGHYNASFAINSTQYSYTSTGFVTNSTPGVDRNYDNVSILYTHSYVSVEDQNAYLGVNKTEFAGYTTTRYITLVFLAMIFSAVLLLVLRMILPYLNMSKQLGDGW